MTVGVLGGGQLGRMLGFAGQKLGHTFRFFDPSAAACAQAAGELCVGIYDEMDSLKAFAEGCDVVTYEFENVPTAAVEIIEAICPVYPPRAALAVTQDRLSEKMLCNKLGIATAEFRAVDSADDLPAALAAVGGAGVLKTRRMGYDGKGQFVIQSEADLADAAELADGTPCILEQLVPFERELSIIGVRGRDGAIKTYPLVQNEHREGILRFTTAPAPGVSDELSAQAINLITKFLKHFEYVGILTVELFQVGDTLLVNELAPRVHNSGHWSIEGAETSQFENHMRAVCGEPLGSTKLKGESRMINMIGSVPPLEEFEADPRVRIHLYGKEPKPGRKIGHITLIGELADIDPLAAQLSSIAA